MLRTIVDETELFVGTVHVRSVPTQREHGAVVLFLSAAMDEVEAGRAKDVAALFAPPTRR